MAKQTSEETVAEATIAADGTEVPDGKPARVPADDLLPRSQLATATGDELDASLAILDLPRTGSVEDRRARLTDHYDGRPPADEAPAE